MKVIARVCPVILNEEEKSFNYPTAAVYRCIEVVPGSEPTQIVVKNKSVPTKNGDNKREVYSYLNTSNVAERKNNNLYFSFDKVLDPLCT